MVPAAAVGAVDLRRPAELAHHHDQRLVEQAAVVQVAQQGREGLVELRQQVAVVEPEVVEVRVPDLEGGELRVRRVGDGVGGHEADARLDQPAGEEKHLAHLEAAVTVANAVRLPATGRTRRWASGDRIKSIALARWTSMAGSRGLHRRPPQPRRRTSRSSSRRGGHVGRAGPCRWGPAARRSSGARPTSSGCGRRGTGRRIGPASRHRRWGSGSPCRTGRSASARKSAGGRAATAGRRPSRRWDGRRPSGRCSRRSRASGRSGHRRRWSCGRSGGASRSGRWQRWCIHRASRGNFSQIDRPGTLVAIGRYGPRTSEGLSG